MKRNEPATKKARSQGLSTLAIHGGAERVAAGGPVVQPIIQSVNFVQEIGTAEGLQRTFHPLGKYAENLIEAEARRSDAVLVLEPALAGGALKTSRKGIGQFHLHVMHAA